MRGATVGDQVRPQSELISIHAPLAGCDIDDLIPYANNAKFQSTHPSRGATRAIWIPHSWRKYFNPRAPCGARPSPRNMASSAPAFQSTRPVRGATLQTACDSSQATNFNPRVPCGARLSSSVASPVVYLFQSTRPVRGATRLPPDQALHGGISIHAPRAGRDSGPVLAPFVAHISIHAPRAGRDSAVLMRSPPLRDFNPRAPCGARLSQADMCF